MQLNKINNCNICNIKRPVYNLEIYNIQDICGKCHINMCKNNVQIEDFFNTKNMYNNLYKILYKIK